MVEVGGSFVGHFLWASYMGDLKDNNTKKADVWNQNASDIPKILNLIIRQTVNHFTLDTNIKNNPPYLAFTFSKPTMETPEQCMEYVQS